MKTFNLLAILLMLNGQLFAQSWFQQNSNTTEILADVFFLNNDTGFACGANGTILKTTDGGTNWVAKNSTVTDGFNLIRFVDNNVGYASGIHNGMLVKSIDGGETWTNIGLNLTNKFDGGIWFTSPDTGVFAVGDSAPFPNSSQIYKTTDGGLTWSIVYTGGTEWISYFFFGDKNNGYATAFGGNVIKTTDGGGTWTKINLGFNSYNSGIYFFDKDNGFVGGGTFPTGPSIFKTTDGFTTWQPIDSTYTCSKLFFVNTIKGYGINADITGAGPLTITTDGGYNWVIETTPKMRLRGMYFVNGNLGYAVGDTGVILKYGTPSGINNIAHSNPKVIFYPNPFTHFTTIEIYDGQFTMDDLKIYNLLGEEVHHQALNTKHETLNLNLPSGIYFYKIFSGKEVVDKGKLAITD